MRLIACLFAAAVLVLGAGCADGPNDDDMIPLHGVSEKPTEANRFPASHGGPAPGAAGLHR